MAASAFVNDLELLRNHLGWLIALGIALAVLGVIALIFAPAATLGTVIVLGWLITVSGAAESVCAFRLRRWGGMFLHLVGGVLGIFLGLLIVTHPLSGALALTMLLAAYLTMIGLLRAITAARLRYRRWGWIAFDGLVTLVLGLLLWAAWPVTAPWFLGFAVGVALLLRGWATMLLVMAIRGMTPPPAPPGRSA
jgi:uncharacterized membrane protein HdeD (DUF308 family)